MKVRNLFVGGVIFFLVLAIAAPVTANMYSERIYWEWDVYSTYDEIFIPGNVSAGTPLGFSDGEVYFSRDLIREWYGGGYYILTPGEGIFEVTATFFPPVRAFGLEMMPYDDGFTHDMTLLLLNDGQSLTQTVGSGGGAQFFGGRSDSGIASITISTDSNFWFSRMVVEPFSDEPYEFTANAGPDQTVDEGSTVTLNGSGFDPDGHLLNFFWYQLPGTPVILSDPFISNPTFVAPPVGSEGTTLTFILTVSYFDSTGWEVEAFDDVNVKVIKVNGNHPPIANAGADQSVNEGYLVTLNGSGSSDPDNDSLTFNWTQIAGTSVSLDLTDPVHPKLMVPLVPAGGETLTFQLTVNDGQLNSNLDSVNILVKNVNHLPEVDAGDDQTVKEGSSVTLDGSGSFDFDGEPLTYSWVQTGGTAVDLSNPNAVQPTFTSPLVGPAVATLTFELTVWDGIDYTIDTVDVFVENVNHPPEAYAGADQTVNEGTIVTLNGKDSSDPDGDMLTYTWTQISGTAVVLSGSTSSTPSFTAPLVSLGGEDLKFQLVVDDGLGGSDSAEVTISVKNINDPPRCDLAEAYPPILWPPNHKLIPVTIVKVTDPNSDQITITVTGVTQDEPVNFLGDGDTSPDAVIEGNNVLIRAERSGLLVGNGRVYRINFNAFDGIGGSCTGSVAVCVPHDRRGFTKGTTTCVDDGQLYDSLTP